MPPSQPPTLRAAAPALAAGLLAALLFLLAADPFLAPPDCAMYWSWAASLVHDGDFAFYNQFEALGVVPWYRYVTGAGRLANDWPMGSGIALAPAVALGPLAAQAWVCMLAAAALRMALPTLAEDPRGRALALAGVLAGTPLLFYLACGPFFSHAVAFAVVTAFLVLWRATLTERTAAQSLLLGVLLGASALVRPQLALLGLVFLAEGPRGWRTLATTRAGALLALGIALGAAPAPIAHSVLYGSPLALPKSEEMLWLRPALGKVLFSDYHGILPWTPLYALGAAGLVALARRERVAALGLGLVLATQLYVNAANYVWWAGGSFGNRRMLDVAIVVAIGVGALWEARRARVALVATVAVCVLWTLLLLVAERRGALPLDRYVPFGGKMLRSLLPPPGETLAALSRPLREAIAAGAVVPRVLCALALGGAVAWLFRPREASLPDVRAAALAAAIAALSTVAVAAAAVRTPPVTDPVVRERAGDKSGILWDAYTEIAFYHNQRGEYIEALVACERAIAIRPLNRTPYWYAAAACFELRRFADARAYATRVLELDPQHEGARRMLKALDRR